MRIANERIRELENERIKELVNYKEKTGGDVRDLSDESDVRHETNEQRRETVWP